MHTPGSRIALLLLFAACRASGAGAPAAEGSAPSLPPSALGGAVRALDVLATLPPAESQIQVRALSSDSRRDPRTGRDYVRVFVPITVYAPTLAQAEHAFREAKSALQEEARADARAAVVSESRVWQALGDLDWDPPGHEDWVSVSSTVRLEVAPGRRAPAPASVEASVAPTAPQATATVEDYVRDVAARPLFGIGQVGIELEPDGSPVAPQGVRCRIRPADPAARYSRLQIAGFLGALEAHSPAARVTRLEIQRSQDEPDPHAQRGWTFEAELHLRAEDPSATSEMR